MEREGITRDHLPEKFAVILSIAKHLHIARHPERYGLRIPTAEADWAAVTEREGYSVPRNLGEETALYVAAFKG